MNITRAKLWMYLRTPAESGGYRYERVGPSDLTTENPPVVDDLVLIGDGNYRVVARQWDYPAPASPAARDGGALLMLILELASGGLFTDEEETP